MKVRFLVLSTLAATAVAGAATAGEEPDPLNGRFGASLALFVFGSSTVLRADGPQGPGTVLDLESDLGFGSEGTFRFDGYWRIADRHKLRLMWFTNGRASSAQLDRDISFDGVVYPAGSTLTARLGTDIVELAYEYAFWKTSRFEVTGSAGLHLTRFNTSLDLRGDVDGSLGTEASLNAPLPVLGLQGTWSLGRSWYADAGIQFFSIKFDGIEGQLRDMRLRVLWQPRRWFGIGAGFDQFHTTVTGHDAELNGKLNWTYSGPMVFVSASF